MSYRPDAVPESLRAAGVTRRELEVFWLAADHLHNQAIADRLQLSVRTVESHVSSLLKKLGGLESRQALIEAAARLRSAAPAGLPKPLSSFVGREHETEELRRLVGTHRLVTLIGPAGCGKTRLALHFAAATDLLPTPVLVDLATAPAGADVERLFADALGLEVTEPSLRAALRNGLADGPHWFVVDNCEHVIPSTSSLLAELLASTPDLHVLATSHGPLGVGGEVVYPVPPLAVPPDTDRPQDVLGAASVRLFADRAATAAPGFGVDEGNARSVAELCRRLDGLPLAIELAAARVRMFAPAELVAHLDDRFGLLAGGTFAGGRHPSLEGALRWSYELLDDDERLLLERCSVFPGGFDYDTVAETLAYAPFDRTDLARLFPRLLDRSMVTTHRRGQSTEYRMLDSIRAFAAARLAARGEADVAAERHARHHLGHGPILLPDLQGRDQAGALDWLDRQWVDVRAAMRWALERGDVAAAWGFLAGVGFGWEVVGMRGEMFEWLDTLLAAPLPEGTLGVQAAATTVVLLWYHDVAAARDIAERVLEPEASGSGPDRALALLALGRSRVFGDPVSAVRLLVQAETELRARGDDWHAALAVQAVASAERDHERGLGELARAADLLAALHDDVSRANSLNLMAAQATDAGTHLDEVGAWIAEARRLAEATGNRHERLHADLFQARPDVRLGKQVGLESFTGLLAEFRRLGDRRCMSRSLVLLGEEALASDDRESARRRLSECVPLAVEVGHDVGLASALRMLAGLEATEGAPRRAAVLLGAADAAAARVDPTRRDGLAPDGELRAMLRRTLGQAGLSEAMAEGSRTSADALVGP
jgi:predicted ATPase/DNA-binding CsgD family transcriptional regulator